MVLKNSTILEVTGDVRDSGTSDSLIFLPHEHNFDPQAPHGQVDVRLLSLVCTQKYLMFVCFRQTLHILTDTPFDLLLQGRMLHDALDLPPFVFPGHRRTSRLMLSHLPSSPRVSCCTSLAITALPLNLQVMVGAGLPPLATNSSARSSPALALTTSLPPGNVLPFFRRTTKVGGTGNMEVRRLTTSDRD